MISYTKLEGDVYHIYTFDLETRELKQLTFSDPALCGHRAVWSRRADIFQSFTLRADDSLPPDAGRQFYFCARAAPPQTHATRDRRGCTSHPRKLPDGRISIRATSTTTVVHVCSSPLRDDPDGTQQQGTTGTRTLPRLVMHFSPDSVFGQVMYSLDITSTSRAGSCDRRERERRTLRASCSSQAATSLSAATVPSDYGKTRMVAEWYPTRLTSYAAGAQCRIPIRFGTGVDLWVLPRARSQ